MGKSDVYRWPNKPLSKRSSLYLCWVFIAGGPMTCGHILFTSFFLWLSPILGHEQFCFSFVPEWGPYQRFFSSKSFTTWIFNSFWHLLIIDYHVLPINRDNSEWSFGKQVFLTKFYTSMGSKLHLKEPNQDTFFQILFCHWFKYSFAFPSVPNESRMLQIIQHV